MATAALRPRTVEPDARLALGSVRCPPNPQSRVSKDGTCGGYTGYTCKGSVFGNGCSRNGYCGKTSEYCGAGCNSKFGTCGVVGRPRSLAAAPRSDLLLRGRLLPRRSALLLRRVLRLPSQQSALLRQHAFCLHPRKNAPLPQFTPCRRRLGHRLHQFAVCHPQHLPR
ncbi:chitin recognition protein [Paraphaeosphaeria sporulosa]